MEIVFDGVAMPTAAGQRQREDEKAAISDASDGGRERTLRRDFFASEFSLDSFPAALLGRYRI